MKKLDDRGYEKITWGDLYREETWFRIIVKITGLVVLGLLVILFMVSTSQAQAFEGEYVDVFYRPDQQRLYTGFSLTMAKMKS